jgi:transposase
MEATGYSRWFERLLAELGFEVWIGNAAEIKIQPLACLIEPTT